VRHALRDAGRCRILRLAGNQDVNPARVSRRTAFPANARSMSTTRTNRARRPPADADDPLHNVLEEFAELVAQRVAGRLDGLGRKPGTAEAPPDFCGEREIARRSGLSVRTLQGWRSRGVGPPAVRAGSRVLYPRVDFERWLAVKDGPRRSAGNRPATKAAAAGSRPRRTGS